MGQILHSCATMTAAMRRAIQKSQESLITLAKRHGVNPKTVAKWRAGTTKLSPQTRFYHGSSDEAQAATLNGIDC